jgi:hypothetical protein
MFKCYQMNYDGTNLKAVHARTKKEALVLLGTTAYQFKRYGFITFETLPTYGEAYYKLIGNWDDGYYPWRTLRYSLRHTEDGVPYYNEN